METRGKGRPSKMESWLPALKEVLDTENILFLTDNDLRILTNEKLPEEQQITDRTFKNWKAGKWHESEETGKVFLKVVEKALIKQKQWIGERMLETTNQSWVRYAWLLERKFAEFNLKQISENVNRNELNVIQITASNEEQRKLIDNIINVDFEDIQPVRILASNDNKEEDFGF